MPISIVVPQLGESVAEGTVSKWLKAEGDRVRKEEPIVEIQTDKINVEIPSPEEGTLAKILVAEGTTVLVGTEIACWRVCGEAVGAAAGGAARAPAAAAAPSRQPGPTPEPQPEPKAPPAPRPTPVPERAPVAAAHGNGGTMTGEPRHLSPAVRRIMREQNVGLEEVEAIRGSGVAGRVTRDDLLDYLRSRGGARPAAAPAAAPAAPAGRAARGAARRSSSPPPPPRPPARARRWCRSPRCAS